MYSSGVGSKEKLIEAMAELMWEYGYSVTSPRAVRGLSDVGQGSVYHYFSTKRGLGPAALNHNYQIQLDSWKATLKGLEDPPEILATYLALPRDPLKGCRVGRMAQDKAVMADDGLCRPVAGAFTQLREMLTAVIGMARSQGRLSADLEPDHLAHTIVAAVQSGCVPATTERDRAPYGAACQGALELLRVTAGTAGATLDGDRSASS